MKSLTIDQLPEVLDEPTIEILVDMALEFPKTTFAWAEISKVLEERGQLNMILNIVQEKQRQDRPIKPQTPEEIEKWKRALNDNDPNQFYGNMGQPETPEEYKYRYGSYPPGYEGNKSGS